MLVAKEIEIANLLHFVEAKTKSKVERGDLWGIDTDRTDRDSQAWNETFPYEKTFQPLLQPYRNFAELVRSRVLKGKPAFFLDLFGSGKFIASTNTALGVLGIRSKDIMAPAEIQLRPDWWKVVEGNIFNLYPGQPQGALLRREIDDYLQGQNVSKFDFITCRPFGPFENDRKDYLQYEAANYLAVYYHLFREFYNLLSSDSGMVFTVLPSLRISTEVYSSFDNFLQDLGCEVLVAETDSYYHDEINLVMRVTKTNSSIPSLPLETPCLSIEQ